MRSSGLNRNRTHNLSNTQVRTGRNAWSGLFLSDELMTAFLGIDFSRRDVHNRH